MNKKSIVMIIAVVLCIIIAQSAFAYDTTRSNVYLPLEVKEEYTLDEALWFNPTIYAIDVLQFIQAYLDPENPVDFYLAAAEYTDEQIEENFIIYQAFIEPEYAGYVNFEYSCDVEAYAESVDYHFDPNVPYVFSILFEEVADVAPMFPRGIGRANAYNTFRRCALQLAIYAAKNGKTPGFQICYDIIQETLANYEKQFEEAMAAEAAATGTVVESN